MTAGVGTPGLMMGKQWWSRAVTGEGQSLKTLKSLLVAFVACVHPVMAQGNAVSMLGTVVDIGTTALTLKRDDGGALQSFALTPKVLVLQAKPATLSDIRPHDFVASASVRGVDGKLHSTELRIFPEALRGLGEGQRPMNDPRGQVMTNATVTGAAVVNGSDTMEVTFPGGQSELVLAPGVPVTRIDAVDRSLMKIGTHVRVQGNEAGSEIAASRITLQ